MACRQGCIVALLLLLGGMVFGLGIDWGLPSRDVDPFLFGGHPVWSGKQILELAGPTDDPNRGADVASHMSADREHPVVVNATDAERARIVRRYRLMSYQPDEWNTLKALAEMKPGEGKLDPKLYQYGGLWVYPVGGLLKIASVLHLIDLRSDMSWYLDHPEAFGRFYIVARCWSACWGMAGIIVVYVLVRRLVGGTLFPALASLGFIAMPVVVNMAHEAKPHLAGAVLMLMAVLASAKYVEQGSRRAWMIAGALCGAALGMVISTLPIFILLPAMVLLRRSTWRERLIACAGSAAVGVFVYAVTNPYVLINAVAHRGVLESNLGNSTAMYHPEITADGLKNTAYLIAAGTSPLLAIAGVIGALALAIGVARRWRSIRQADSVRFSTQLLLLLPAICMIGQALPVAMGKPGEFGRFFLFPDLVLMIAAVVAVAALLRTTRSAGIIAGAMVLSAAIPGFFYLRAFVRDNRSPSPRLQMAAELRTQWASGRKTIAIFADPAPYCLPPMDLFDQKLLLMPKGADAYAAMRQAEISVQAVDVPNHGPTAQSAWTSLWWATPISWADKPMEIRPDPSYRSAR